MEQEEKRVCKQCGKEMPLTSFYRNKYGYTQVCKECANANRVRARQGKTEVSELKRQLEIARNLRISQFTPRELMAELHRQGYEGSLTYTEVHTIDISKMKEE